MERMDSNHLFAVLKAREASGGKKLPHSIPILDHPLLSKHLRKKDKGIVRKYLRLYSGYTESHIDHLISEYATKGMMRRKKRTQPVFPTVYTGADIELLAEVSEAFDHQNGQALKAVCREMHEVHGDKRFTRLSCISVSRLYDLKKHRDSETRCWSTQRHNRHQWLSASEGSPIRAEFPAFCGWTRCIKETKTRKRECITSIWWMR